MWPDKHWVAKFLIFHGLRNFACGPRSLSSRSISDNVLFLCKLKKLRLCQGLCSMVGY